MFTDLLEGGDPGVHGKNMAASSSSQFRGVFHASEDPAYWQEAMEEFPNRVPRFTSKDDTVNFIKTYCQIGSNPDEPHLRQSITLMTTWSQIERYLIPKIREYRGKWKSQPADKNMEAKNRYMNGKGAAGKATTANDDNNNDEFDEERERAIKDFLKSSTSWRRYKTEDGKIYYHDKSTKATEWTMPQVLKDFVDDYNSSKSSEKAAVKEEEEDDSEGAEGQPSPKDVYSYLTSRLDLPVHRRMNNYSAINTLKYLFFHMRCGIYVMIRNSEVAIFSPFVNKDYRNNWADVDPAGEGLKLECSDGQVGSYYAEKQNHYRRENVLEDRSQWWANGNIICNEHEKPEFDASSSSSSSKDQGTDGQNNQNQSQSQYWGDQFLLQLKDMLAETCRLRRTPDCEFFINKRDYPQLKVHEGAATTSADGDGAGAGATIKKEDDEGADITVDMRVVGKGDPELGSGLAPDMPVEPYGFIFDKDDTVPGQDIPLSRYYYNSYAPILSFYTSKRFADIPMPPSEDWESACGEIFPPSFNYTLEKAGNAAAGVMPELTVGNPRDLFTAANLKKFDTPWEKKVDTAFFRGGSTGGGTCIETNQRLRIAQMCYDWEKEEQRKGSAAAGGKGVVPRLDAKITGWNMRDKKIATRKMTFVRKNNFSFEGDRKKNFVEIYKQSSYKYLVYVEGHCAACRYGFMMQLGSVILKVDSLCVADSMWYFPLLRPYHDHVPVKADMSDLQEKIDWCRANDGKCRDIAANAKAMYSQYVSRDGILDYMQAVFIEIAKRWECPVPFGEAPPALPVVTKRWGGDANAAHTCCLPNCGQSCEHAVCLGCTKAQEAEKEARRAMKEEQEEEKHSKESRKELLRQRRLNKAAAEKAARTAAATAKPASPSDAPSSPPAKKARTG
jgi:hypothetical protein